jgi:predicted aconitase with swiveling domain
MVALAAGRPIVPGEARGAVLLSERALSLWGGIDPKTGQIIDHRHDRCGEFVAGRVFALPSEKGSSTGSAVLLELVRIGKAPSAIITRSLAPILALGSIIARELYDVGLPILLISEDEFGALPDGETVQIDSAGEVSSADKAT